MKCTVSLQRARYVVSLLVPLLLINLQLLAQTPVTVKGTISGKLGEPLNGVTIIVKGSTTSVLSKEDGTFEVQAPLNSTLVVSYVGHKTAEVKVTGNNLGKLDITLQESRGEL